ncbi:MAG: nucleotide exchange factor GrpE [Gaiella sp.]|nr:nucleotide exchange factor GrpE [Gaiella sp.]
MSDEPETVVDGEHGSPSTDEQPADRAEHDAEQLLARLQDAERQYEKAMDDLRRVAADFDNYRKRVVREQTQILARSGERVVGKLLPVLDDLERALDAAEHHEEAKVLEGVRMTKDSLVALLASEGVEEIPADGPFDPHVHEALMTQPAEGVEPGHVAQVIQRGYRIGDAVLRPARVVVAEG